jgi:hypothetical protein
MSLVRFQHGLPRFKSPSSSGLGHRPFTAVTRVRVPLGTPEMVQHPPFPPACARSRLPPRNDRPLRSPSRAVSPCSSLMAPSTRRPASPLTAATKKENYPVFRSGAGADSRESPSRSRAALREPTADPLWLGRSPSRRWTCTGRTGGKPAPDFVSTGSSSTRPGC